MSEKSDMDADALKDFKSYAATDGDQIFANVGSYNAHLQDLSSEDAFDVINDDTFGADLDEIKVELDLTESSKKFHKTRRRGQESSSNFFSDTWNNDFPQTSTSRVVSRERDEQRSVTKVTNAIRASEPFSAPNYRDTPSHSHLQTVFDNSRYGRSMRVTDDVYSIPPHFKKSSRRAPQLNINTYTNVNQGSTEGLYPSASYGQSDYSRGYMYYNSTMGMLQAPLSSPDPAKFYFLSPAYDNSFKNGYHMGTRQTAPSHMKPIANYKPQGFSITPNIGYPGRDRMIENELQNTDHLGDNRINWYTQLGYHQGKGPVTSTSIRSAYESIPEPPYGETFEQFSRRNYLDTRYEPRVIKTAGAEVSYNKEVKTSAHPGIDIPVCSSRKSVTKTHGGAAPSKPYQMDVKPTATTSHLYEPKYSNRSTVYCSVNPKIPPHSKHSHKNQPALEPFTGYIDNDPCLIDQPLKTFKKSAQSSREQSQGSIMTDKEIEQIFRIQIFQLVTDFPYRDDYYYRMYELNNIKSKQNDQKDSSEQQKHQFNWQQRLLMSSKIPNSHTNTTSNNALIRLQSIIDGCVYRKSGRSLTQKYPQSTQGNTLGESVSRVTFKTPRKLILMNESENSSPKDDLVLQSHDTLNAKCNDNSNNYFKESNNDAGFTPQETSNLSSGQELRPSLGREKSTLILVEKLYDIILEIETLTLRDNDTDDRSYTSQLEGSIPRDRHSNNDSTSAPELHTLMQMSHSDDKSSIEDINRLKRDLEKSLDLDAMIRQDKLHRVTQILNISKGIRLLPRFLAFLDPQKAMKIFYIMIEQANMLNIFNGKYTEKEVDIFLNWALPSLLSMMLSFPLPVVSGITRKLIAKWVPSDPQGSKPGLALLTIALSRAEMLKSKSQELSPGELEEWELVSEDIVKLSKTLVDRVFHPKNERCLDAFSDHTKEDLYAWKFFVALVEGVPASSNRIDLIRLLKKRIVEVIRLSKDLDKQSGVNQFLSVFELRLSDVMNMINTSGNLNQSGEQ